MHLFLCQYVDLNKCLIRLVITKIIQLKLLNLNTISMHQTIQVVTPIAKVISTTTLNPTEKFILQDKNIQGEEKTHGIISLQILGSTLVQGHIERRNSAFSFYDPVNQNQTPSRDEEDSQSSEFAEDSDQDQSRRGKREKKDKRQQSRLETKNLNRYFRSKINQMLRDIKISPSSQEESRKADEILTRLNTSNKIMFSEIREIIKDEWLQEKLRKCSGVLMRYIHGGKMGMQSKLIMLKYFNKILKAIRNPENFTCWK